VPNEAVVRVGRLGNVQLKPGGRQRFLQNATFYSFNELRVMMMKSGLTIIDVCSTIFQKPAEKPLRFEAPRRGLKERGGVG
jgi:hypothetical protein